MEKNPIQGYREAKGLSQGEMAELLGCSDALISHIETGKRSITPERAIEWEPILGIPRSRLCPAIFQREAA